VLDLFSHARPFDDPFTDAFGHSHILKPLWQLGHKPRVDVMKNVWLRIGSSETLFSCHYDTAHYKGGWQHLEYDEHTGMIWKNDGAALGGDDSGGIWVLRELIAAGKPGLYIFHNGEERGCVGSTYIAEKNPQLLAGIKRAIAFDRRGTKSIITEMSPGKVCSSVFANALAHRLDMGHTPDPTGSMTDTGKYRKIVPEVTNVSVGYMNEHGPNETMDVDYLLELVESLKTIDFETLPTVRDPAEVAPRVTYSYPHYKGVHRGYEDDNWHTNNLARNAASAQAAAASAEPGVPLVEENAVEDIDVSEMLIEMFGVPVIPHPYDETPDFVWLCMEVMAPNLSLLEVEEEFITDALTNYARACPEDALDSLKKILGV
jgi:hypothetical protein